MVATAKGDPNKTLFVTYTSSSDFSIMSGGINHAKFWSINGKTLKSKKGIFGRNKNVKIQPIVCAVAMGSKMVSGVVSGHLYVWEGNQVSQAIVAHSSSVYALRSCESGFASGGKDGLVKLWNRDFQVLKEFNLTNMPGVPPSIMPEISAVFWDASGNRLVVGTRGSEIYEILTQTGSAVLLIEVTCFFFFGFGFALRFKGGKRQLRIICYCYLIIHLLSFFLLLLLFFKILSLVFKGHFEDELWGLAVHPTQQNVVATCGDDKTVRGRKIFLFCINVILHELYFNQSFVVVLIFFFNPNNL